MFACSATPVADIHCSCRCLQLEVPHVLNRLLGELSLWIGRRYIELESSE